MNEKNRRFDAWCTLSGYTNRQIADAMGLDESYISLLRHGQRAVSSGVLWRLSRAYGVAVAEQISGNRTPQRTEI